MNLVIDTDWDKPYTREKAVFPLDFVKSNKFWPSVRRVDDAYGDRNLHCTCNPISDYIE
jgi:glycine dehydrogenase